MMLRLVLALLALLAALPAAAHEVRPAYLEIVERADGRADVLWKQPSMGEVAIALRPRLGDGLLDRPPDELRSTGSFAVAQWRGLDLDGKGLDGRTVAVEGLENTITDTLAVVRFASGDTAQHILTPGMPRMTIDAHAGAPVAAYLMLGVEHILTGIDHLLFVFGLILLSSSLVGLLRTITAFTLAHSITLALTALGLMSPNPHLIEALVALSILFLAVELVRKRQGHGGVTQRYPWLIAFAFGLLHGAAFAGALKEIGLPQANIPGALFLFNVGVELGQLAFVLVVTGLLAGLRRIPLPAAAPRLGELAATYAIGTFSMFWVFERLEVALRASGSA